jgi:SAM-dependent methyltransferase
LNRTEKTKPVPASRWEKAQKYERNFWSVQAERLRGDTSKLQWYEERATTIWEQAKVFLPQDCPVCALEIGPGPVGLINYLDIEERDALDPLENYYKTEPHLVSLRDKRVRYRQGTGEDVSKLNKIYSFIIIDNVLDHVQNPGKVLKEIHNNLVPGGIMFISINIYTQFGSILRGLIERWEIDKGHPFNFTQHSITTLIENAGFHVLLVEMEDYGEQKKKYRQSRHGKLVLKSYLGVVDFRFSAFCRRI